MTTSSATETSPDPAPADRGTIEIACACDRAYLPHAAAMLRSVIASHREVPVKVHLLHGPAIKAGELHVLKSMFTGTSAALVAHEISSREVVGLPTWDRIPVEMWHRIMLPELLPVDRIVYLDIDVVVREPLTELWNVDMGSCLAAAVTNIPEQHLLGHARQLGLAGPEEYFNSGVLVMNLAGMRNERTTAALLRYARERTGALLWPDQDALNVVLAGRRLRLHPRWNLMNSIRLFPWSVTLLDPQEVADALRSPAIVHFEGADHNKPWHLLCSHPLRHEYLSHRRQTPWPRFRPEGITPRNLARLAVRSVGSRRSAA